MGPRSTILFLILSIVAIDYLPLASSRVRNLSERKWCVTALSATDEQMQANIDWLCGQGKVDCNPIKPGGPCFEPNTLRNHASFVMNEYYQNNGRTDEACYFNDTSMYLITDPSYGDCVYEA
ncbi:hypothetical protein Bca52824_004223 [Brassica carinata]|uniref:X8 domain-containing protein n=1 Tax=Brassica carinata TaxID=52824 RepID=A0A8X7WRK5_BRACI|nr:hypothetical protein Bca52824_004223 [Brassica carinata]